jgi:formylglycine-generating enzyme required for sulfatase activity
MGSLDGEGMTACISPFPMRTVTVTGFYMGKYTVMQAQYEAVMGQNPSVNNSGKKMANFPVEYVSWYDAVEFCNALSELEKLEPAYVIDKANIDGNNKNDSYADPRWTVSMRDGSSGYRLPTEAEWEYACRAGTETVFSMGETISRGQANIDYFHKGTIKVGSYAPNPWGLYDMHGNVWEWCWDWVYYGGDNYYDSAPDPDTNPTGLSHGNRRAERGGAWNRPPLRARSAYRERARPNARSNDLGFRVVRPIGNQE